LSQVISSAKETLRWFTIKDAITRLFFLREAQPAGFPTPFNGCLLPNITGRGIWRLPKQSGRFPDLFRGGLTCPGQTDACACSPCRAWRCTTSPSNGCLAGMLSTDVHNINIYRIIKMKTKNLVLTFLLLAVGSAVNGAQAQTCEPTSVTPYIRESDEVRQKLWATFNGRPLPLEPWAENATGGSWSWSGCGTSGSSRVQFLTPSASCTATVVYTNACGTKTTQAYTITVPSFPSYNTNPIAPDASGMSGNATQLAAKIKLGINPGNTMEAYCPNNPTETCWGNPAVSAAYIKLVKDSGFDAIRIPLAWDQYANQANGKISDAWLNRVKAVVQMAVDNGLYVLVNIHWDGGWLESNIHEDSKVRTNAKQKAYWEQIATKLRDFDEHVMFASANEPRLNTAAQVPILDSYHKTFVDAVRSTGGRNAYRVLVVQGLATDVDLTTNFWQGMPADTVPGRQMMEVHYYPGFFSNKGEDDANGLMHCYWGAGYQSLTDTSRNASNFWRLEEEAFTDAQFDKMKSKFVDQGIPVLLGEYAAMLRWPQTCADYDLHLASREYFWKYVTKSAVAHGLLPFGWETGGLEGYLIDRATPAVHDTQVVDAMLVGAGKAIGLSNRPNSWNLSGGVSTAI
jgi:endoglucanase